MQKLNTPILFLLLLSTLFFSSCIGYSVKTNSFPEASIHTFKQKHPVSGWQKIEIFEEEEPTKAYHEVATIVVTGNQGASMDKLFKKMRKEAGRYAADAIIYWGDREVHRTSFDGISTAINIICIFEGSDGELLDMGGDYYTTEIAGVAIKYADHETD